MANEQKCHAQYGEIGIGPYHKKVLLQCKHMTITGPYPNKRQRRSKDSTRYRRPTVKKTKKCKKITFRGTHCLLRHYLCKNFHFQRNTKRGFDTIFAKNFTIKGTHNGLLNYLCTVFHLKGGYLYARVAQE